MTVAVLKRVSARQSPIVAYLDFDFTMFTSGADIPAIQVPAGAVVTGGEIIVDTVWNSATSDVISLGDPTTFNRYKSALALTALALTAIVPTGFIYVAPTVLSLRWVGVGAVPTTGKGRVRVEYYKRGRDQFAEGADYGSRLA